MDREIILGMRHSDDCKHASRMAHGQWQIARSGNFIYIPIANIDASIWRIMPLCISGRFWRQWMMMTVAICGLIALRHIDAGCRRLLFSMLAWRHRREWSDEQLARALVQARGVGASLESRAAWGANVSCY
jgi:hypothetical protein